eukprot:324463-Chlamydomonas_euryale.AAC.11
MKFWRGAGCMPGVAAMSGDSGAGAEREAGGYGGKARRRRSAAIASVSREQERSPRAFFRARAGSRASLVTVSS